MQKALSTIRIALPLCLLGSAGVVHAMPEEGMGDSGVQSSRSADTTADRNTSPADGQEAIAGFGKAVDDKGLDEVRGGFDLGDGLVASLGIQQVAYIDGNLVASTSINIPNVGQITAQQAVALASALGNANLVIQNGPGNSVDASSLAQSIQNNVATTMNQGATGSSSSSSSLGHGNAAAASGQGTSSNGASAAATSSAQGSLNSALAASMLGQTSGLGTVIQNTLNNQSIQTLTTLNISVNTLAVMRNLNLQNTLQAAQMLSLGH